LSSGPPPTESVAGEGVDDATACKAVSSGSGRLLPLRPALRRIPCAAFWLKKYLDRPGTVGGSSTSASDDEHAPSPLGYSEVLSVQHSIGDAIPAVSQRPEDDSHIPSSFWRQEARDVLKDDPTGMELIHEPDDVPEEAGSFASQALATSCDAEVLARESSGDDSPVGNKSSVS
jgi:hypothetical protein